MCTAPRSRRPRTIAEHEPDGPRPAPETDGGARSCPGSDRAADPAGEPLVMSREEFEDAVGDSLDLVPEPLMARLDNVVFLVEDEPPPDEPDLLGLYDGIPLTERDWGAQLPDRIFIYRGPLLRLCTDRDELLDEIAVTVVHEIAHHFGIDDARLHELGWG